MIAVEACASAVGNKSSRGVTMLVLDHYLPVWPTALLKCQVSEVYIVLCSTHLG
jgi:hypothetical protein